MLVQDFLAAEHPNWNVFALRTQVYTASDQRARVGQWFFMGMSISGTIGTALIYWFGGRLVLSGAISTGTIVAFAAFYLFRLYGPISALTNVHIDFSTHWSVLNGFLNI